jgi:hypothetical protein
MEIMWIHLWINGLVFFPHLKHLTSNVEHPEVVSMRLNEQENRGIEPILHLVLPIDRCSHQVNRVPGAILDSRILVVLLCKNTIKNVSVSGKIACLIYLLFLINQQLPKPLAVSVSKK